MKRLYLTALLFTSIIFLFILNSCGTNGQSKDIDKKDIAAIPVEVSTAEIGDIEAVFSGTATLEAENEATVVAKAPGVVKQILVEEGQYVTEGKILAKLDDEQQLYKLNQAKANLNKLENEYDRNKGLFEKNLISADAFEKVRYDFEAAKASYDLAELDLKYAAIRAPINGVVSNRYIKVGNMIQLNQQTFRITDFDPLNAILFVPERHLNKLAKGQKVKISIDALTNYAFVGVIDRISPVVDPQSGTFKVTAIVSDPDNKLKPGMFGRVHIIYDVHAKTLLVPKEAVITEDKESSVFVIQDTMALRRMVKIGYINTTHLEITDGLRVGDTVVTIGQASLKDSARVEVITAGDKTGTLAAE
jgi:membrane fusion protein (multidrug efflux system)